MASFYLFRQNTYLRIRPPAKVGLVIIKLLTTSPVVS